MRTTIRLRSSLATATNPVEWDTAPSPTYSPRLPEQQLQDRHRPVSSLNFLTTPSTREDVPDIKHTTRKTSEPTTASVLVTEEATTLDNMPTTNRVNSTLRTYQGQALTSDQVYFAELEPAPFPKDIHSSMPYINRDVSKTATLGIGPSGLVHNDLQSFEDLEHNMDSTIYRGTLFEYQTQEILKNYLGIYTQRSAGNGDLGVDLRGTWFLPLSASPKEGDMVRHLKVIVQCKKMTSKIGPKYVRELQGSLSFETQPTMAILATSSEYTKQALLPYAKSLWPMALVVIDTDAQEVRKLMWNRAAEKVMHGLQVGTKWMPGHGGKLESRPVLCFKGKVLQQVPGPYLSEGQELTSDDTKAPVDYAIPDWNINTQPECIHVFPEQGDGHVSRQEGEDVDEDASTSPLQSSYLELLTWHTPSLPPLEQMNESLS
ncbi:hypothetical protein BG015_001951 [Linnemannia schmuckeri]|uniref:Restriction endonuclease type IV Mrr domain-containing protein n=1 Tax=Linnemannia schmuckeri TaxID=64567 RepID=A0A9P5RSL8_9FUNG|nr:hypothetical protein BG015_001951 [Linnemannia schmuckeri]